MKTLLEVQETSGVTPKALLDRPRIAQHDRYYLDVYYDLAAGRGYNQAGIQPLSVEAITTYMDLVDDRRYRLFQAVRSLDAAYLKHVMEKKSQTTGEK
jgi:hypothetical protein